MRHLLLLGILSTALYLTGCETCTQYDSATCGEKVNETIQSFTITTITGSDSTDADLFFCVELQSADDNCQKLDTSEDNFESNKTDEFTITLQVDPGELRGFYLLNEGGALLGNNEWGIASLEVEATVQGGDKIELYDERYICDGTVGTKGRYIPKACNY